MDDKSSVGLGHYAVVMRRQWKIITMLTILGVIVAVGYISLTPVNVTASTLVNLNVIVSDPFSPAKAGSALLDATTETQLATSYEVAKAAAETMHNGNSVEALRAGVAVATAANATTMKISFTSTSDVLAQSGADAIANAYIAYRQAQATAKKEKLQSQLSDQLTALDTRLASANLTNAPSIQAQIGSVQSQLNLLSLIDTSGGSVLNPATQNAVTYTPQKSTVLATGLFGGLVLGLIAAFAVNILDRRVRDWYDVRGAGAGPVLAKLSLAKAAVPAVGKDLDSFRVIRERLLADVGKHLRVLTVIDETLGSPSDVATNLSIVLAQSGTKVRLVLMGVSDSEMRADSNGLQLVTDDPQKGGVVFRSEVISSWSVLRTAPTIADSGADDFVTEVVRREIVSQETGTLIVLALPPDAPHASRLAAGRLSDSVLIVGECLRTRIDALAENAAEMKDIQASLVGTVLVPPGRTVSEPPVRRKTTKSKHMEQEAASTSA